MAKDIDRQPSISTDAYYDTTPYGTSFSSFKSAASTAKRLSTDYSMDVFIVSIEHHWELMLSYPDNCLIELFPNVEVDLTNGPSHYFGWLYHENTCAKNFDEVIQHLEKYGAIGKFIYFDASDGWCICWALSAEEAEEANRTFDALNQGGKHDIAYKLIEIGDYSDAMEFAKIHT